MSCIWRAGRSHNKCACIFSAENFAVPDIFCIFAVQKYRYYMETKSENTGSAQNLARQNHKHSGLFRTDRVPGDTVRFRYDRFMFDVIYPYLKKHYKAGGDGYGMRNAFIRMFNIPNISYITYLSRYDSDSVIERCVAAFRKICGIQSKYTGTRELEIHFIILDTVGDLPGRDYHGDSYQLKLSDESAQEMDSADAEEIRSLLCFPDSQALIPWNESLFYGSAPWHLGWLSGAGNEPDPAVWMLSQLADRYVKEDPVDMDKFASDALAVLHGDIGGGLLPVTEIREKYAEDWLKSGISSRKLPDDFIYRVFKKSDIDMFTKANPMILPYRSAETGGAYERNILKFKLYQEYFSSMSRITGTVTRLDCWGADSPAEGVQEKDAGPAGQRSDNAFAVSVIVENIRTISNTLKAAEESLAGVRKALDMLSDFAERKLQ